MTPKENTRQSGKSPEPSLDQYMVAIECKIEELYYGDFLAVRDSHINIKKNYITGFIGPSGCGKSTVLRCINRMNDLIRSFRFKGQLLFHGIDIYDAT